jgi:transcriptional regulator with XRE-family HTH domain
VSIGKTKSFLVPDPEGEATIWGRVDQGRRELAAVLRKDVTVEKLAELIGLAGPSLAAWKRGSRPKKDSLEKLAKVFLAAGLYRYTAKYLDYGEDEPLSKAPPPRLK